MDMRVLVIPDVHLKTPMFIIAEQIMNKNAADMAIFLGDLPDDWGCEGCTELYKATFDAAIGFKKRFPNTKYCFGNHEMAYWFSKPCSGTDIRNLGVIKNLIKSLQYEFQSDAAIIHKIDNVLFSHAGLTENWIRKFLSRETSLGVSDDDLIDRINFLDDEDYRLWQNDSPIWVRPQHQDLLPKLDRLYMWKPDVYLQVVGHTPLVHPEQEQNLLSCDVFSTYPDGRRYGMQEWVIVDTEKQTWEIYNGTD